jgi:hypothetical protein
MITEEVFMKKANCCIENMLDRIDWERAEEAIEEPISGRMDIQDPRQEEALEDVEKMFMEALF